MAHPGRHRWSTDVALAFGATAGLVVTTGAFAARQLDSGESPDKRGYAAGVDVRAIANPMGAPYPYSRRGGDHFEVRSLVGGRKPGTADDLIAPESR